MRRAALALAACLAATGAAAHSWYDNACCNERDCHPYEGKVVEGPDAYVLEDGTRIPVNDPKVRQGLDDQFHICIGASGALLCFYRPLRGS